MKIHTAPHALPNTNRREEKLCTCSVTVEGTNCLPLPAPAAVWPWNPWTVDVGLLTIIAWLAIKTNFRNKPGTTEVSQGDLYGCRQLQVTTRLQSPSPRHCISPLESKKEQAREVLSPKHEAPQLKAHEHEQPRHKQPGGTAPVFGASLLGDGRVPSGNVLPRTGMKRLGHIPRQPGS